METPKTYGETLYRYLKEAILTGELRSAQRLQEREIAKRFNVSATPVREAFRRLSAENYLTINACKEVVVVDTTMERIREIFSVISNLDVLASKGAIANLTEGQVDALAEMTDRLEDYHQGGEVFSYMKLDLEIHKMIWQACGNRFLYELLVDLGEKYSFHCNNVVVSSDNPSAYLQIQDHIDIVTAFRNRNSTALSSILAAHWGRGVIEL